jgi:endonuclease YncB( thermonuclease family)
LTPNLLAIHSESHAQITKVIDGDTFVVSFLNGSKKIFQPI